MDDARPNGAIEAIRSEQEDAEAPLRSYEILSYPADFTLEVLVDKFRKKEIVIPEFQRRYIWTKAKASKLIESFLLGLPVPPVYLYKGEKNTLLVVDGQQRLLSIVYFFNGVFGDPNNPKSPRFSLVDLHEESPYRDATMSKLRDEDQESANKLCISVLRTFVMKQINPAENDESIFTIFERLNNGGVTLHGQEIRNAIYFGPMNSLIQELNDNSDWRKIFGRKPDQRMRDRELIVRFFALYYGANNYKKPMKEFLNKFMGKHQKASPNEIKKHKDLFTQTAALVKDKLGEKPFNVHRGLNMAVFDAVFTAFAHNLNTSLEKQEITRRYKDILLNDSDFINWTGRATTDDEVVQKRIALARRVLFGD